jgi:hypothetical protein
MDTLELTRIICGVLTAIIGAGGFKMYIDRRKYIQEVAKLKAGVDADNAETRGRELDNVQKAMQILMQEVVEPLKKEINAVRKEVGKLRKAVEKANTCPFAIDCPVRGELQKSDEAGECHKGQHPKRQPLRADDATCADELGPDGVSGGDTGAIA